MSVTIFLAVLLLLSPAADAASLPSIDVPLQTDMSSSNDAALVVGNEDYAYLADVPFAAQDAQAFSDWLVHTRGVPAERVHLLVNASHAAMKNALETAAHEVGKDGVLWVYFAGHGAGVVKPDGSTERALIGKSAEADVRTFEDFVVRVSEIEALATQSAASQAILVLDACYANTNRDGSAVLGGRLVVPAVALPSVPRVNVWTAVSGSEVAEAYESSRHGLFTYFVLSALRGQADGALGAADGSVTLDEAKTWVSRAVRIVGDHRQNPEGQMDSMAGSLSLVKGLTPVEPMQVESLPRGGTSGGDSLGQELERIRKMQEQDKAAHNERSDRIEAARTDLLKQASAHWETTLGLARQPGEEGELAVRSFLSAYESASVMIDGVETPVTVPEVEDARMLLVDLITGRTDGRAGRSHVGLFVASGVSLAGGVALLAISGVQEKACLQDVRDGTTLEADAESLRNSLNVRYAIGYGLLGLGGSLGFGGLLDGGAAPGFMPGFVFSGTW